MSIKLTAAEREAQGAQCVDCGHRVIWHHDERGCQYHGNGRDRCPCEASSDAAVANIIAARMAAVEALASDLEVEAEAAYDGPGDGLGLAMRQLLSFAAHRLRAALGGHDGAREVGR